MKLDLSILIVACLVPATLAGPLIDLDFDSARTNNVSGNRNVPYLSGLGPTADLVPGWTLTYAGQVRQRIGFNVRAIGGWRGWPAEFTLFSQEGEWRAHLPVEKIRTGKYVFYAQNLDSPAFLTQVGDIPGNATELALFTAKDTSTGIRVLLNGTEVINSDNSSLKDRISISSGNISAFAGQKNVRLEIELTRKSGPQVFPVPDIAIDRLELP